MSSNVIPVAAPRQKIFCAICGDNEAHYVSLHGDLVCGLCPIKYGIDSISFKGIGALLLWSRRILAGGFMNGYSFGELREIVGRVLPTDVKDDYPAVLAEMYKASRDPLVVTPEQLVNDTVYKTMTVDANGDFVPVEEP